MSLTGIGSGSQEASLPGVHAAYTSLTWFLLFECWCLTCHNCQWVLNGVLTYSVYWTSCYADAIRLELPSDPYLYKPPANGGHSDEK